MFNLHSIKHDNNKPIIKKIKNQNKKMKKLKNISLATLAFLSSIGYASAQTAELQVIHNSADPAATQVDVYVNGTLTLDNFAFRTATPFVTLPAGIPINIGIAAPNSTSVNDTLKNFSLVLSSGQRYVAIANGVLNPSNFALNPDGASTGFTLFIQDNIQTAATMMGNVDFRVVHGATDAPTVDVIARNVATLVNNAPYSAITDYISVPAANYLLDVTPGAGSPIVATFQAGLSGLGGGSAIVFASGFLNPSANQSGPAFGLYAALANGTVVAFPQTSIATLQVIHNAADPAAASVDIYVNGTLALDNFAFRTATPFIEVPADVQLNIGVAPPTSMSVSDTLKNFQVTLANGGSYVAIANGVLNPSSFASNPDAISTAFTLFLQNNMRQSSINANEVDFRVVHGATDAPTVDVIAQGVATIVNDAPYSAITDYISVPAASYTLNVTPGNDNATVVASFNAPLSTGAGASAVVLASGFLNPTANQNGEAFALIVVLADGTVLTLNNTITGVDEKNISDRVELYPNPAIGSTTISFSNETDQINSIEINDITGKIVKNILPESNQNLIQINIDSFSSGLYFVKLIGETSVMTKKLIVR